MGTVKSGALTSVARLSLAASLCSCLLGLPGAAQGQEPGPVKEAAKDGARISLDYCALPLCRDAEALREKGDRAGALKLYRYIQDEVDVSEAVMRKPLLWFVIAALHAELEQPAPGLVALHKYQQYIESRPDADLPAGQRREDVERLQQSLSLLRLRQGSTADAEPAPAALQPDPTGGPAAKVAAEAERHIEAGLALSRQGLQHSARVEFDQAYELSQRPELLLHIAELLLARGQLAEASAYLSRYLSAAPRGPARSQAEALLHRIEREQALEVEVQRARSQPAAPSGQKPLRQAGAALLAVGAGVLATGLGLGIGAVVTARSVESGERFDPSLLDRGLGLQNAGLTLDVLGLATLGAGAVCLGVARRREAIAPSARAALPRLTLAVR